MFAIDKFKFKVEKESNKKGVYIIEPLPKGYGVTLGNTLRRILLSSIEGAAVTSIKVTRVKHEYSTLPGVMDDILSIILKLKQLSMKSHSDEPQVIELKVRGKKIVKASDLKLTSEITLANPDLEITELTTKDAKLDMKITVERGSGYIPTDEGKRSQVGVIPIDANFSPVKRVIMEIGKTRVGQKIDLDQIKIEIHTNGAVSPREAIEEATKLYNMLTVRLKAAVYGEDIEEDDEEVKKEKGKDNERKEDTISDLDIDKLNLSVRLTNSLLKAGYENLTELEGKSIDELTEIRGLGKSSAEELIDIMKSYKLEVKE